MACGKVPIASPCVPPAGASPVYLGLGSNLGDREGNLRKALALLDGNGKLRVTRVSGIYETDPVGYKDQPPFLNLVAEAVSWVSPRELLGLVKGVEASLGRKPTFRWGPRVMDIDILLYGGLSVNEPDLQIPHPRMWERGFVLVPLAELLPCIPESLAWRLGESQGVRPHHLLEGWQYAHTL